MKTIFEKLKLSELEELHFTDEQFKELCDNEELPNPIKIDFRMYKLCEIINNNRPILVILTTLLVPTWMREHDDQRIHNIILLDDFSIIKESN